MFDAIRKHKDNFLLKIFGGILILSFGIWGVGDFIGTSGLDPNIAIKVGDAKIPLSSLQRQFNQEIERMRSSSPQGPQAVQEPAIKRSIMDNIVQQETRTATMNAAAAKMDLVISDAQIRDAIHQEKAFQDASGQFSAYKMSQVLGQNSLNERSLIDLLRSDLREDLLFQIVAENSTAPKLLSKDIFDYRAEMRTAETILVPTAAMAPPAPPSEDDVKKLYDKNIATFTAPEYRKISAVLLSAADLAKPDAVAEDDMKAYYDQNKDRYRTPAKRDVAQIVFDSEEKAAEVRAQAKPDESLTALAERLHTTPAQTMNQVTSDSPIGKIIAPVFDMNAHEISQPVKTDLGWHLFEVTSITPESTMAYDDVKEKIRTAIAQEKATDEMYEKSVQLEDSIAAGTPLPDTAKTLSARLVTIPAMDHDGKDPQGAAVPDLTDRANMLRIAFNTPSGADSGLKEFGSHDGYFVLKVDSITPPSPKPLDSVRAEITTMWDKQERMAEAKALADKIAGESTSSGFATKAIPSDSRISHSTLPPVDRTGDALQRDTAARPRISPDMLDQLFTAKINDVFVAPVADGMEVARLMEIKPADASGTLAMAYRGLDDAVKNGLSQDLVQGMTRAFTVRYPAEVNTKALEDIVNPGH